MNRRELLAGLSAASVTAFAAPQVKAEPGLPAAADVPFLCAIAGQPDLMALCYPKSKIDHAYCYMLDDFSTIFASGTRWCDGSPDGWREITPGQFDGRIVGRVVSVHIRQDGQWYATGSGYLAG